MLFLFFPWWPVSFGEKEFSWQQPVGFSKETTWREENACFFPRETYICNGLHERLLEKIIAGRKGETIPGTTGKPEGSSCVECFLGLIGEEDGGKKHTASIPSLVEHHLSASMTSCKGDSDVLLNFSGRWSFQAR